MGWTYLRMLRMARAGLAYVAMLAAIVSAGTLGFAGVWAFTPEEEAALAPSVPAGVALPAGSTALPEPPGIVAPAIAAAQAPAPERVTASAPAMAAASAEPLAPSIAIQVPRSSAASTSA